MLALLTPDLVCAADPPPVSNNVQAAMQQYVDDGQLSGAVTLVADRDGIRHLGAVGKSDLETERDLRVDDLFWIASLSKPFAATAVMILQDDGRLSIDDPVSKHLADFEQLTIGEDRRPVQTVLTIRHLLTHTSGLSSPPWPPGGDNRSLDVQAAEMASLPLHFEPGSKWAYSNSLNVAGRIVEVVSGLPFAEFVKQRITDPLGMHETTFHLTDEQHARFVRLYKLNDDKSALVPAEHKYVTPDPEAGAAITPSPSGGLFSTAEDLSRFYRMLLNGGEWEGVRVLSPETVQAMTTIQTGELKTGFTTGNGWGLGFCIVREPQGVTRMLSPGTFGHGGAYGTQGWIDPERGLICILMIQRPDLGNSDESPMRDAFQAAAVSLFGQ
ncbi:MAG: beta-lactamase family protein [Planctomycetaceae bacterium]|nr:beta-lactamase family protein [Planctomycetaceae bacterium]